MQLYKLVTVVFVAVAVCPCEMTDGIHTLMKLSFHLPFCDYKSFLSVNILPSNVFFNFHAFFLVKMVLV